MSMDADFREISQDVMQRLIDEPSLVEVLAVGPPPVEGESNLDIVLKAAAPKQRKMLEELFSAMSPEQRAQLEAKTAGGAAMLKAVSSEVQTSHRGATFDWDSLGEHLHLDKAWHGVHYLLCDSVDEVPGVLGLTVLGGAEIGPDLGYGPARYLKADEVDQVSKALTEISEGFLSQRFDPMLMERAHVYPGGWDEPDNREWLLESFAELQGFYARVAGRRNLVLKYLS